MITLYQPLLDEFSYHQEFLSQEDTMSHQKKEKFVKQIPLSNKLHGFSKGRLAKMAQRILGRK